MSKSKLLLCLLLVGFMGCASLRKIGSTATIVTTDNSVTFTASRPTKMTMKDGEKEYTFDSQTPSLLSRIMSAVTLGAVGGRR